MKYYFFIIFLVSTTFSSFSQEKSNIFPFINPPETKPRYLEDIELTESQNNVSFNAKIKEHFLKHMLNSTIKDSIKHKLFVSFKIDTTGVSMFYNIKPQNFETMYLKEQFSDIINSLPKFIPATQRNKKVSINYVFIYQNK